MQFTANSLESHWMPFTGNRDFKSNPRIVTKAEGVYFWDQNGGKILDASSALFCSPLGHGREEIAEAVYEQLQRHDYSPHFQMGHPGSFELAEKVTRITPDPLNHIFFTNSGSESVDTAIKIAMAYHRANGEGHRIRFVSRERAYHGVNIGGVSLSGMVKNRETFPGVMPNVVCLRHTWMEENAFSRGQPERGVEFADDLKRICETYGGTTIGAVFVEPIAGSTGVLVPPKGYLERLREICDEHGILLVFDEVICGFGRTGKAFGAQSFGVTPDIMTIAKALTNGAQPMGGVVVRDEIYKTITNSAPENSIEFFHGYTYSGHPAACAAGIATQNIFQDENLFERANGLVDYFQDSMFTLKNMDCVKDIRGYGLMNGIELKPKGAPGSLGTRLQKELFWNGVHIKFTGDCGIVAPPFIIEKEQIDNIVSILRETFSRI